MKRTDCQMEDGISISFLTRFVLISPLSCFCFFKFATRCNIQSRSSDATQDRKGEVRLCGSVRFLLVFRVDQRSELADHSPFLKRAGGGFIGWSSPCCNQTNQKPLWDPGFSSLLERPAQKKEKKSGCNLGGVSLALDTVMAMPVARCLCY